MRNLILNAFEEQSEWNVRDLQNALRVKSGKDFTTFVKTMNALEDEHILYNNHAKYFLIDNENYMVGVAKDISRFEYAVTNPDKKVYVPKKMAKNVFDRDEVLVQLQPNVKVVHIYRHDVRQVIGKFIHTKKGWVFFSDIDFHRQFQIKNMHSFALKNGMKAVVEITKYSDPLEANIVKLIGMEKDPGVDITSILFANHVRMGFGDKIQLEVTKLPQKVQRSDLEGRVDYRSLDTVTIDGDDARDFDDAISIQKEKDGYVLYVHIADVSHYVKEGSAIDQEAYARSTSVYVTDRVVPMLPFELSNGICSLNPDVDRCTLTCKMHVNKEGICTSYSIVPSIIHSNHRCTYKKVNQVLSNDVEAMDEYQDLLTFIYNLDDCTKQLKKQSKKRGCIDFQTTESQIVLNKKGKPISIQKKERGIAEEMIEECMILANVCVANYLHAHQLPCMYRVHESPDPDKIVTVTSVAHALHVPYDFYPDDVTTKELQTFLDSIESDELFEIFSMVTLRAMQKAKYSHQCIGHFGLSLSEYCHFTSPIRRYSDLVVHRMLRKYLFEKGDVKNVARDIKKIERQSYHVSQKERDAILVERIVDDYKKAEYMESRLGQVFDGTVVGVTGFGFFVELNNSVEGLVPLRSLMDFYTFDEAQMCLVSESNRISLGQHVRVMCKDVNRAKGQIEFALQ